MSFLEEDWEFRFDLPKPAETGDNETTERNRRILMTAFEALAAGDAESFWSIYDPDVVFHEPSSLPYGGAHKGIAATQEAVARRSGAYAQLHTPFEEIVCARDIARAYRSITFRIKSTGRTGTMPAAELYRFRNGKVNEWRALYSDPALLAEAIAGDGT
jgi:ketosteroid isomerase-like protein